MSATATATRTWDPVGYVYAVDGISLTLVEVEDERFSVALIPHTLKVTTLGHRQIGDEVNLETDILAKYVERQLEFAIRDGTLNVNRVSLPLSPCRRHSPMPAQGRPVGTGTPTATRQYFRWLPITIGAHDLFSPSPPARRRRSVLFVNPADTFNYVTTPDCFVCQRGVLSRRTG